MYKFLILAAAALVVCVSSAPHHGHDHHEHEHHEIDESKGSKGEPIELDTSNPEVMARLKRALATADWPEAGVKKINRAVAKKVEGTIYTFDFDADNGKHCLAKWAEEPWVSQDPEHVTVNCH